MDALVAAIRTKLLAIPSIGTLAPGGVHPMRPQGSAWPAVVIRPVVGVDHPTYSEDRCETHTVDVQVFAPADASGVGLGAVYDAVHAALQRQPLTIAGYAHTQTMRSARTPGSPIPENGVTYRRAGGSYTVWIVRNA
jgi:Protein of unknown function (DUF3168)